jgi:hypothetical protein
MDTTHIANKASDFRAWRGSPDRPRRTSPAWPPSIAAALVLGACAAPATGARAVVLESDAYGCGAAPGLGCGLAIAPVLAEIDGLDGVAWSGASWDGRLFRIELEPGADPERVAAAVAAVMTGEERRAAAPSGADAWYDAPGTVALSRHEAGVIAADLLAQLRAEVELDQAEAERLQALLRADLERAFERAHAAGGGVHRLWGELPEVRVGLERRLDFLAPEDRALVLAFADRELAAAPTQDAE